MSLTVKFLKYHGCGNDFILVDELDGEVIPENFKGLFSTTVCRRRFSIGGDDVLYIVPSILADASMRVFEPDGSESDMCGNGIRCAGSYLFEKLGKRLVYIETRVGVRKVERVGESEVMVDMGNVKTRFRDLKDYVNLGFSDEDELINICLNFPVLGDVELSIVNSGEPHVVIFVDDVESENLSLYGDLISKNRLIFPFGINVNLVEVLGEESVRVRTFERGVWDETLACGTGSVASVAVAKILGKISSGVVNVILGGGVLKVVLNGSSIYMIGPAVKVYEGVIKVNFI